MKILTKNVSHRQKNTLNAWTEVVFNAHPLT